MTPYNLLPPDTRVWIYQCSRKLTDAEINLLNQKAIEFISTWTAHDLQLKTYFELRYEIFFFLMVDEKQAAASGCSIDSSVRFIRELENVFGVSFTNRMLFAYRNNSKEILIVDKNNFERLANEGIISDETFVFNNLVTNKSELETGWEIPFSQSWHKKIVLS